MSGSTAMVLLACGAYIALSSGLISFNKLLMSGAYFPFAMALTTVHMATSLMCSVVLYCMVPGLFPSMAATQGKRLQILRYFAPLAVFFTTGVVASNEAYKYCGVAFLQFVKQGNVVGVFALSCLVGSQVCDRLKLMIVVMIVFGCGLAVTGEMHFMWFGFFLQVLAGVVICFQNALQEWIMRDSDVKLDPLTYNFFMSPCCLVALAAGNIWTYDPMVLERFLAHWHLIIPNALIAFMLNVTVALVIKRTSAMGFILSGIVKDMLIVACSAHVFGDTLCAQQILGFSIATAGITLWSAVKIQPNNPVVLRISLMLGMYDPERLPIANKANAG